MPHGVPFSCVEALHAGTLSAQCLLCFQMCPAIDAVLVYVNRKWTNLSGECSPAHTLPLPGDIRIDGFYVPFPIRVPASSPALGLEEA